MDIWSKMFEEIKHDEILGVQYPTSFLLNRNISYKHNEKISTFIFDYNKNKDLTHLYALNRACYNIIDNSVKLLNKAKDNFPKELDDLVTLNLDSFPEIDSIIHQKRLMQELYRIAEQVKNTDDSFTLPSSMYTLGQLSFEIQKFIENGSWSMEEKAHS